MIVRVERPSLMQAAMRGEPGWTSTRFPLATNGVKPLEVAYKEVYFSEDDSLI